MQTRIAGLGVVVAALAVVSPATAQTNTPSKAMPPAASACTVALTPQSLKVQADPFEVKGILSESIGAISGASIKEQDSGIEVAVAPAGDAAEPQVSTPAPKAPSGTKPGEAAPAAQPAPAASAAASEAAPPALQLTFKTAAARPGDWTVAVEGASGMCTGKLHVAAAEPKQ